MNEPSTDYRLCPEGDGYELTVRAYPDGAFAIVNEPHNPTDDAIWMNNTDELVELVTLLIHVGNKGYQGDKIIYPNTQDRRL